MRNGLLVPLLALLISSTAFAEAKVKNAAYAKATDVAQAENFLAGLPSACAESHAYAARDGTVTIRILCSGSGKATDGIVAIKNGKVTQLR